MSSRRGIRMVQIACGCDRLQNRNFIPSNIQLKKNPFHSVKLEMSSFETIYGG